MRHSGGRGGPLHPPACLGQSLCGETLTSIPFTRSHAAPPSAQLGTCACLAAPQGCCVLVASPRLFLYHTHMHTHKRMQTHTPKATPKKAVPAGTTLGDHTSHRAMNMESKENNTMGWAPFEEKYRHTQRKSTNTHTHTHTPEDALLQHQHVRWWWSCWWCWWRWWCWWCPVAHTLAHILS